MNEVTVGIVFLVILLLLFGTGIELGFAMALVGMAGFAYLNGMQAAMQLVGRDIYDVIRIHSVPALYINGSDWLQCRDSGEAV